jgi:hypothetical protein
LVSGRHHTPVCSSCGGPILRLLRGFSLHQDKIAPEQESHKHAFVPKLEIEEPGPNPAQSGLPLILIRQPPQPASCLDYVERESQDSFHRLLPLLEMPRPQKGVA